MFGASGALLLVLTNLGARTSVVVPAKVRQLELPAAFGEPHPELDRLAASSLIAFVVVVVLSAAVGWWVAGRALRPLRTITSTARDISASNLHERLDLSGPDDEVKELGETLNELFGRLEASFESQRHFVANASHELRTPLTAERTLLQVALADPGATVESLRTTCEELLTLGDQQERLIEALLTLASSEGGLDQSEPIDLQRIVGDVVAQRRDQFARAGLRVDESITAAQLVGDPSLIESLVINLVDNAVLHNVDGGWIDISTSAIDGAATISVRNSGPTVPSGEVDRLFQPFQRLARERTGTAGHGLGLAIVAAIADAHGATLVTRARPAGGLDIDVTFAGDDATPR